MARSSGRLAKFLKRYSAKGKGSVFKQWTLIEVRDVGRRRDLVCPCGRSGLRYICFIRNKATNVQTYVGSHCVRNFTYKHVPRLLVLMESLAISGVSARYLGSAGGRGRHRWAIKPSCRLVRRSKLLSFFFSALPFFKSPRGGFQLYAYIRHNQYTFRTPRLKVGNTYNITLGPVTGKPSQTRPALFFYADRIRPAGKQMGWGKQIP